MNEIDRLAAVHEIQSLKARYYRSLDTKDWAGLEATLAPDLTADFRDSGSERNEDLLFEGAATFVGGLAPMMTPLLTAHHGHMPEIEILSPTSAQAIWALEDHVWAPEGVPTGFRWMHGVGHSHETYTRLDGEWRIQTLRLTRVRLEQG